jgi:hypothetical protein
MKLIATILIITGLSATAAFMGWALYQGSQIGGGWSSLAPIWPYVAGGLIVVGALTGGLMWLAFYSDRKGYDDRVEMDGPH